MRKGELAFNYLLFFVPIVLGLGVIIAARFATVTPNLSFWSVVLLYVAGFLSFMTAKLSVIKQQRFFSFGTANMSRGNKVAYLVGYGAMSIASLMLLGYAVAMQNL